MMNMKDRLVKLLEAAFAAQYEKTGIITAHRIAAVLEENGVLVQQQGEWKKEGKTVDGNWVLICPFCLHDRVQQHFKEVDHYCPHCGAKLYIK